jgi:hypothetical protein
MLLNVLRAIYLWLSQVSKFKAVDPLEAQNDQVYETRNSFERALRDKLAKTQGEQAKTLSRYITNYIFDFGEFDFDPSEPKGVKQVVNEELINVCTHQIIDPLKLCQVVVHRAVQLKRFGKEFESHLRDLWTLCLLPVGPFTPRGSGFPLPAHLTLLNRMRAIEVSDRQVEACLKVWQNPALTNALKAWSSAN